MKRKGLPQANSIPVPVGSGVTFDVPAQALARWNAGVVAKEESDEEVDNTISMYDPIGFDPWTGGGVTAKRIAAALRTIGAERDVIVNINSPGGDLFEGIAIYNILREHKGEVLVRIVGMAASAASTIAMAGDRVQIARTGFIMIHNSMVIAIGNRNDMRDTANWLEQFDDAMASVYAARSGIDKNKIAKMMDKETWMSGDTAIEDNFADELLPADQVGEREDAEDSPENAVRQADLVMARAGLPRSQRRALINSIKESGKPGAAARPQDGGTPGAAPKATQDAGDVKAALKDMHDFLNNFGKAGQ